MKDVTIYYLEMISPSSLKAVTESKGVTVCECEIKQFQFNKFLYDLVGSAWQWTDKRSWSDEQWKTYAEDDNLRTWVAYRRGTPAGYYELHRENNGDVEIAYFGLAPRFIGTGIGGYFLSHAITSAWSWNGTKRVWVHTCTLDHPGALPNYQARGMTIYLVGSTRQAETNTSQKETGGSP